MREYVAYVWTQDHGVLGDAVLDDFNRLPDIPVGARNWLDVYYAHFFFLARRLCALLPCAFLHASIMRRRASLVVICSLVARRKARPTGIGEPSGYVYGVSSWNKGGNCRGNKVIVASD